VFSSAAVVREDGKYRLGSTVKGDMPATRSLSLSCLLTVSGRERYQRRAKARTEAPHTSVLALVSTFLDLDIDLETLW
jgi:hypothetical protein